MIYKEFQGKKLSQLGFGTMRLPTNESGEIDEEAVSQMVAHALANGVNYFDTAWPYHDGKSEMVVGKVLSRYPRDSYYLATKFPGHQIAERYDPAAIFEAQLKKCGVEYFDFYLLHNVYENSIDVYLDEKWGILDYFKEQKRLGRIKHLGFSSHAGMETLTRFLDVAGEDMEFCQIQLNWMDWTLQDAKSKVKLLNDRRIPVWVMEPVRGGRLCNLNKEDAAKLKAAHPSDSIAAWGFRFLQDIEGVCVVLSGMSNMAQMQDNIQIFSSFSPLSVEEKRMILDMAEGMKDSVPCTGCRYCTNGCPMALDIPVLIEIANELRFAPVVNTAMRLDAFPKEKRPHACIGCGACRQICPQGIDIPQVMTDLAAQLDGMPKWRDICKERAKATEKWMRGK